MKRTALLCTLLFVLFGHTSIAQIFENFENMSNLSPLEAKCWRFHSVNYRSTGQINGSGTISSIQNVNATTSTIINDSKIMSPYINFQAGTVISFLYELNDRLSQMASRKIALRFLDQDSVLTTLDSIVLTRSNSDANVTRAYTFTLPAQHAGVKRLVIDMTGTGDGNTVVHIDDFSITRAVGSTVDPSLYYASSCNSGPVAVTDNYTATTRGVYTGTTVLHNDSDPDGEALTAALNVTSPHGTVVMNSNGTFTFTPHPTFTGTFTSFTYTVTDNGYVRLSSTATVNIHFPVSGVLPHTIVNFSAITRNSTNTLSWQVTSNESINSCAIEKSSDGRDFQTQHILPASSNNGMATYTYADAATQRVYYRLKITGRNGLHTYSNIIACCNTSVITEVLLMQNPVTSSLQFSVAATANENAEATIFTLTGLQVHAQKVQLQRGNNTVTFHLSNNVSTGTYVLKISGSSGVKTAMFIKQ